MTDIVRQYHGDVFRYAYRLSGTVTDAEDLTQQTFLIAQQKLDQLRQPDRLKSWLLTVVRNCYLKGQRRRRTGRELAEFDLDLIPETVLKNTEIDEERLQMALFTLPDEFRLPVVMFYFEQLGYEAIAEQLSIPKGTVMSRLHRGKKHLRRMLFSDQQDPTLVTGGCELQQANGQHVERRPVGTHAAISDGGSTHD